MTDRNVFNAMRGIDAQLILDAAPTEKAKKNAKSLRLKRGAIAACLCLLLVCVFTILPYEDWREHQTADPNWHLTHFQAAELSDIEAVCGTSLLLDKIALPGEYHSEYILEITEDGDFENTDLWSNLSVQISYGDSAVDSTADNIYCLISFDGDTDAINEILWESDTVMELNGHSVQYSEKTTEDYAAEGITMGSKLDYHGYAVFTHNGYTYYLATNSDAPDFYDSVINQMLGNVEPSE